MTSSPKSAATNDKQLSPPTETHDPYKMRSLEQILSLFDGGEFLGDLLAGHRQLQHDLLDHRAEHGAKDCKGTMTIKVDYALGKSGDVAMGARVEFKSPKKPPANAAAYINDDGELTLYSPLLTRMQQPVRDVPNHDPETGEIRDAD
ncbi:hypothetical protein [Maritalea sp.]|uniref:hypothetical protein n=1 Tax=Maritalea sp. TaxID=2003361 RepID=UPI003EF98D91